MSYAFGDYYYIASSSGNPIPVASSNSKRQNGFQIRRIYFQYDRRLDARFGARLRFEINDPGFGKTDRYIPYVKAAYLQYSHAKSGTSLFIGMSGTPTWEYPEQIWGYRSVEKTIMDVHGAQVRGNIADLGLAIQGKFDKAGKFNYWWIVGNGTGTRPESDNKKKVYGSFQVRPVKGLLLEAYGDYEPVKGDKDVATLKGFVGYVNKKFHGGVEAFLQNQKQGPAPAIDNQARGISAFGAGQAGPNLWGFGRVDWFDPNNHKNDDRSYLMIAGLDIQPIKDVHLMPNFELITYQKSGVDPDFIPRITFFYTF